MREKPCCQDLQKHLKEGRKDGRCNEEQQESDVKVCEDEMKKLRGKKDCAGQRRYQKEVWSDCCC